MICFEPTGFCFCFAHQGGPHAPITALCVPDLAVFRVQLLHPGCASYLKMEQTREIDSLVHGIVALRSSPSTNATVTIPCVLLATRATRVRMSDIP